jgi:hypothetical protein
MTKTFTNLKKVAEHLRREQKKHILIFAYNGIGKTRLSMEFKNLGKQGEERDTIYFNAFTEDLFSWDNDLDNDEQIVLQINQNSHFFEGLKKLEIESRIRSFLQCYVDFDFYIDYDKWTVSFSKEIKTDESTKKIENIKISRGEENIFVWCMFLVIAELAIEKNEDYSWVKYLYIDDPISSLDDNNAIAVACHLSKLLKNANSEIKTIISSHHHLFFNVMYNEFHGERKKNYFKAYFLSKENDNDLYLLTDTGDTPRFHHVALLKQLHDVAESGKIYTYHFNILRNILEKTATFHGFKNFSACIDPAKDDPDGIVYTRMINILSHGNYSLFEPQEMMSENKEYFSKILKNFMSNYRFNPELFTEQTGETNRS